MTHEHPQDVIDRMESAKAFVAAWYNSHVARPRSKYDFLPEIEAGTDVYVVWFAKTLGNWKAMLSTNVNDGRYYEATYNGEKHELYLEVYKSEHNATIREELVGKTFEDSGRYVPSGMPGQYGLPLLNLVEPEDLLPKHPKKLMEPPLMKIEMTRDFTADIKPSGIGVVPESFHTYPNEMPKSLGGDWDMHPSDIEDEA